MKVSIPDQSTAASTVARGIAVYGSLLGRAGGEQIALVCRPVEQPALSVDLHLGSLSTNPAAVGLRQCRDVWTGKVLFSDATDLWHRAAADPDFSGAECLAERICENGSPQARQGSPRALQ